MQKFTKRLFVFYFLFPKTIVTWLRLWIIFPKRVGGPLRAGPLLAGLFHKERMHKLTLSGTQAGGEGGPGTGIFL